MLNAMRQGAKSGFMKFILLGFMVMAVGGLVMMDVGGFFRGGVTRTAIAKIGNVELPIAVFDRTVRRTLATQGLDIETAYKLGFINQILRNEISNNILQRATNDQGLMVGQEAVLKRINRLIEPLVTEEIDKRQALQAVLRQQGLTESDFIQMVKAQMTNSLLRNALQAGTTVQSQAVAHDLYLYQNEERTAHVFFLSNDSAKGIAPPTDEILLPFYQTGKERYAIPETRSFSLAIMSGDKLKKTMDVSDEELRDIYERDIANYAMPERRLLEQVIVDTQGTAAAIIESVNGGKSLKEAAREHTGGEDAYMGEETFEKEGLLQEIGDKAFEAKTADIIGPVETALGWHVLKLREIIEPATEPFEKVKVRLKEEILELRVADEMFAIAGNIDDALAGGMGLEELAAEMGMEIKSFGPVKSDGTTIDKKEGLKDLEADKPYLLETAFTLMQGEISPVFELADGRYAALRVDTINEKSYTPFEEVRDELAKLWDRDQKEVANRQRAKDALEALNSGKGIKEIAAEYDASLQTIKMVRSEAPPEPLNEASKTLLFGLPKNQFGLAPAKDGFVIGEVTQITLPDIEKATEKKLGSIAKVAQNSTQEEMANIYFDQLFDIYKIKINQRLLETTYGPGSELY